MSKSSSNTDVVEAPEAKPTPRRKFVFLGALAAASFIPRAAHAQGRSRKRRPADAIDQPIAPPQPIVAPGENAAAFAEWDTGGLSRLVRRVTMGMTGADLAQANQMGWNGYLNYQLNYNRIDDSAVENWIAAHYPYLVKPTAELVLINYDDVFDQLRGASMYRAVFSKRQLFQRMVEFWTDHFNQDRNKVESLLVNDQRDVIRKYAMTTFPQLLKASAHSGSMMVYLDQNVSDSRAPNQNYAREIMELHTLGVDGGYTQKDVAELSRVLTGWTVDHDGDFTYNPSLHDTKDKVVLGMTIKGQSGPAGQQEGEAVLDMLVNHPSTARFIATKMLKWMVNPAPSAQQVSAIAAVYRATGGDIKAMLRAMLNEQWISQTPMKLKRPFHLAVSALRSLNPAVTSTKPVDEGLMQLLGHEAYVWDTPDGYPDRIEYWAGGILPRWQCATTMSQFQSNSTIAVDTTAYRAGSPAAAVDLIDQNFFAGEMPVSFRTELLTYAGTTTITDAKVRELLSLAISSDPFQWY
jgi:uncharacterized protein (DUF1800 family)